MKIAALFSQIESPVFHSKLGVVSTPRAFDSALFSIAEVQEMAALASQRSNEELLFNRIGILLADREDDPNFVHPHDMPIAVYLRILDMLSSDFALAVAEQVAKRKNFWWTRAMALRVLSEPKSRSATQYHQLAATNDLIDVLLEKTWTRTTVTQLSASYTAVLVEALMTIFSTAGRHTDSVRASEASVYWTIKVPA
jgi:hypothetical protein